MLTSAEVTQARADVAETLVSSVAIQRATTTIIDEGYPAESWATQSTVNGRIDNLTRSQGMGALIAEQEKGRVFYQLTVTHDADLRDGDRVVVDSVTYQIVTVNLQQDLRIVRRAVVVKVG